jgi:hypothetical protein
MQDYLSMNIRTIKSGDLFWESEQGQDALFIAIDDAKREKGGVGVNAREIPSGKAQHFFEGNNSGAYGPRLYNMPQYTRPDWAALLIGLAHVMRDEAHEAAQQGEAREAELKLAATQYSESRDKWCIEARAAQNEIARLRAIIDQIDTIAAQKANGITLSHRIQAAILESMKPAES